MSEQLKQELEADTDRLEAETVADSETIGEQEEKPTEGKLEAQEDDESKEEDTVPMGKASLVDIVSGIPAPTKEEVEAAEAENAKPVKQKAREKLEAEKKKATQKNFADPVITYLMKRCEEDQGLAEDVMQEGKTWSKCFNYIVEQARKSQMAEVQQLKTGLCMNGLRIITTNMRNRKLPKRKKAKSLRQQRRPKCQLKRQPKKSIHQLKRDRKMRQNYKNQKVILRFLKSQ